MKQLEIASHRDLVTLLLIAPDRYCDRRKRVCGRSPGPRTRIDASCFTVYKATTLRGGDSHPGFPGDTEIECSSFLGGRLGISTPYHESSRERATGGTQ